MEIKIFPAQWAGIWLVYYKAEVFVVIPNRYSFHIGLWRVCQYTENDGGDYMQCLNVHDDRADTTWHIYRGERKTMLLLLLLLLLLMMMMMMATTTMMMMMMMMITTTTTTMMMMMMATMMMITVRFSLV
jgi:hypothetical protein